MNNQIKPNLFYQLLFVGEKALCFSHCPPIVQRSIVNKMSPFARKNLTFRVIKQVTLTHGREVGGTLRPYLIPGNTGHTLRPTVQQRRKDTTNFNYMDFQNNKVLQMCPWITPQNYPKTFIFSTFDSQQTWVKGATNICIAKLSKNYTYILSWRVGNFGTSKFISSPTSNSPICYISRENNSLSNIQI